MVWAAILLGGVLFLGSIVTAQEQPGQPALPRMQGMGPMMGKGMMGGGQMGQMGDMGSMMQMMQRMHEMHEMHGMAQTGGGCRQMMGGTGPEAPESEKK
jgi:hypothetical protein